MIGFGGRGSRRRFLEGTPAPAGPVAVPPRRSPRNVRGLLSAGVAALLLVAGPQAVSADIRTAGAQLLRWAACAGQAVPGAECATLTVPMDPSAPRGDTISVALARLPALNPDLRIGSLLLNPGGPGGSGVGAVAYDTALAGAPEFASLRQRFDIVGFDPRGVGASTPIVCDTPLHNPAISAFPRTPAAYSELARFNRAAGDRCRVATGPLIHHVDTLNVVDDVDAIRRALGEDRISWLGLSYGTEIGALYAERYPTRIRAMVLDGVVDHSLPARQAALHEAQATEIVFDRFASWCGTVDQRCALHGRDVAEVFDRILAAADRGELPASSLKRNITAEEATNGLYGMLQLRAAWPQLAVALRTAAGLDSSADASWLVAAASFIGEGYPAYRTVGCHDFAPGTRGWSDMRAQAARLRAVAPRTWRYSEFWDWTSGCVGWPLKPANPPRPLRVRDTVPLLLVSTRYDPATPYIWAKRVQRNIEGSRLLTVEGEGHTGILHSSCARNWMAKYLIDRVLPPSGSVCPPTGSA